MLSSFIVDRIQRPVCAISHGEEIAGEFPQEKNQTRQCAGGKSILKKGGARKRDDVEPLEVTLYTRPGCHLCEEAKAQIAPLLERAGARLREVNIDEDAELRERYNVDVPVIFLGARKVAKHRVDLEQFRRQLEEARRRS